MKEHLNIALKEWDLVIQALLEGKQAILLRKGGILEEENEFVMEHPKFLLFPTFVHQDVEGVKETWRGKVVMHREEPRTIAIRGWAEVVKIMAIPQTDGRGKFDRLNDLHLWEKKLVDMRFAYRPEKPLYVVVVRAYRLAQTVEINNTPAYAGCKSWVPLEEKVATEGSVPAMEDGELKKLMERVGKALVE